MGGVTTTWSPRSRTDPNPLFRSLIPAAEFHFKPLILAENSPGEVVYGSARGLFIQTAVLASITSETQRNAKVCPGSGH